MANPYILDGDFGHFGGRLDSSPAPAQESYGLPYFPSPVSGSYESDQPYSPAPQGGAVSRIGPTASATPRAMLDPNLRAGSFLAGGFPTQSNYRSARGAAYQRGFTVDLEERLRRRKKYWER